VAVNKVLQKINGAEAAGIELGFNSLLFNITVVM
jgi:hypothetical protein